MGHAHHDHLAAALAQAFDRCLQTASATSLDVAGGYQQSLGNIAVELLEPALVRIRALFQQLLQPPAVRFDLP